jgi:DNA-binding transcriptional regulator YdaS (Cro superfamily)
MLYAGVMNTHIQRAIALFDSAADFAGAIGRSPQFVSQVLKGERPVPADLCLVIERETRARALLKGAAPVLCEELRPDVAWGVIRATPAAA